MKSVYLLEHLNILLDDKEEIKLIGIYSTIEKAVDAWKQAKEQPGFIEFSTLINPEMDEEERGFYITDYTLDKSYWDEGFVSH